MSAVYCLALIAALAANESRDDVEFTKDTLEVVRENCDEEKAVLVDVRSQEEWDEGHLAGSIFLPVTAIRKGEYPEKLTKRLPEKKILYTFCVVGMRAKKAAAALEKRGYEVRALKPGYKEFLEAGFPKADR
jgi:phage shock protein E